MPEDPGHDPPRTVIAPTPGGRRRAETPPGGDAPPAPARRSAAPVGDLEAARPGVNPLVDAAAPLFDLVVYLRSQIQPVDVNELREKVIVLTRNFERRAAAAGEETKVVNVARYAISATIDDVMLSLPWAFEAGWHNKTLVSVLHEEVIGGDRFFELLDTAERDPRRYKNLVELMYLCLSLGFQGRYRRDREAISQLDRVRNRVFGVVSDVRGGLAHALSLRWRGTETQRRPARDLVPIWLAAALAVTISAGLFFLFVSRIGGASADAVAAASGMRPEGPVEIVRFAPPAPPPPEPVYQPPVFERVSGFLEPEIKEGLVEVLETGGSVKIRLISEAAGKSMFGSGRATLQDSYVYTIDRVATALEEEEGRILVTGHSDNVPISTARFPSNFHLSLERAQSVATFLSERLSDPSRIEVDGRGDAEPIADNATREGRARNRRVELTLIRD